MCLQGLAVLGNIKRPCPRLASLLSQVGSGRREQLGGKAREEAPGCDKPRGQEPGLPGLP